MKKISIVTPCYNEGKRVLECHEAVKKVFDEKLPGYAREHIFCDNCSTDDTTTVLRELAAKDKSVKVIFNARNFGILRSTFNGVTRATGDAVLLFMPVDLQDPPEVVPEFVKLWENGYEIVFGLRKEREEGLLLNVARKIYYRVLSRISYLNYPPDAGDFQLVDRKVVDVMKTYKDNSPFMRMMTFDCGFRSVGVPYTWRKTTRGFSHNRFINLIDQGLLGIISYSNVPLRLSLFFGVVLAFISIFYAGYVVYVKLTNPEIALRGIPTIIASLFFFSGVQFIFMGLFGEYLLAIFNQVRERPLVVERERLNFD